MPEPTPPEQGMDEILASIRKIIADDGPAGGSATEGPLVLTERVAPPAAAAPDAPVPDAPLEETPTVDQANQPAAASEPAIAEHTMVDETAATGAASSFDKLSAVVREAPSASSPVHLPAEGRTLEDLTRDLLRPLLKAWLDDNLPAIVEARVDEEVERITRRRVR